MLRRFVISLAIALCLLAGGAQSAQALTTQQTSNDVVIILPFENTSGQREFNWIGESFADNLSDLLESHGLAVVPSDAREIAYQRLRLPPTVIPSRATAIKIAREAGATLFVLGNYEVMPARDEKSVAEVQVSALMISVNEGRIFGKMSDNGRWVPSNKFILGDALVNLQTTQGKLAYQILVEHDKNLPYAMNKVIEQATKVPARAFESYVKGTMTDDREKKTNYLKNAMSEYAKANPGSVYTQAAFELGHLYLDQKDYKLADEYFSMLQKRDPHYPEAAFYAALSRWHLGNPQGALDALLPLTADNLKLTSVFNNAGAIAAQAARAEKDTARRESLLKQAMNVLGRAVESAPEDPMLRYNYAYALMLAGKHAEAAEHLREVVKQNARDPLALFLFAKSLEKSGQTAAATANDNDARKYFQGYAEAQIEWEKSQTISRIPVRLRGDFNRIDLILAEREERQREQELGANANAQNLLSKAQALYSAGRDDEALNELRDVMRIEPMNAEAYLLTGRIYQRRGELDLAVTQLKAAIFWELKTIDAHILLGRIFLERGDRAQAMAYARSAMQIDPNNQEAIALQRQVQTGIN